MPAATRAIPRSVRRAEGPIGLEGAPLFTEGTRPLYFTDTALEGPPEAQGGGQFGVFGGCVGRGDSGECGVRSLP